MEILCNDFYHVLQITLGEDVVSQNRVETNVNLTTQLGVTSNHLETSSFTTPVHDVPVTVPLFRTILLWTVPIICIFGAIGNTLNLIVLALRIREGTECMEKGVLYGLMGLAMSDLLFCLVTIPGSFLDNRGIIFLERGLPYYYAIASEPLQVCCWTCN